MSDDFTKDFRANRDSGSLHPACCAAPGAFLKDALGIYITPQSVIDALTTPAADKTGHRERLVTVLANPPFGAVRHNAELTMAKPNWKRRGLSRPITEKDRRLAREKRDIERLVAQLPPEMREFGRQNPGLLR